MPELSPHPDCFCLPVDFSIVTAFLELLDPHMNTTTTLQILSDTFNICFATSPIAHDQRSFLVFEAELQSFGANDCDLLLVDTYIDDNQYIYNEDIYKCLRKNISLLTGSCFLYSSQGAMEEATAASTASFTSLEPPMALLAISKWDFDCFVIFQWSLLRQCMTDAMRYMLVCNDFMSSSSFHGLLLYE
jgi:hypothetical protein